MLLSRVGRIAVIGGALGAALVVGAWRWFAARLTRPPQADWINVPRCSTDSVPARHADAVRRARARVAAVLRDRRIPGMAVAVGVDGRLVWSEGFGFADAEQRRPACPTTQFRSGSVAKPLTSTAMAVLAQEGLLDLDAPIERYVPGLPAHLQELTARQLASHRAGIRHYRDDNEAFTRQAFPDVRASLVLFQGDSLVAPPDTRHVYSSWGYVLLGAVLEGAAGRELGALLDDRVFRPLGLERTMLERGDPTADRARFYDHVTPYVMDGEVRPAPFVDMSSKWASGGMLTTAEDLVRFGSAMLPGARTALLDPATRAMVFHPRTRTTPPIAGYALGWMTVRDLDLRRVQMHFGAGSGATAWLGLFPDQRVVVAVLANLGHAGLPYAGSIGLASHFAPVPILPAVIAAVAVFVLVALLVAIVALPLVVVTDRLRARPTRGA